jgi:DNA-binding CsgD family transcriptional regulator
MTPNKFQALEVLACISGGERGVRLSAASRRHRDATGHRHRPMVLEQRLPITLSKAREDLGASFDEAWEEGYALTLEEAYSYALRMRGERKRPAHGWSSLTPTERDVVNLVAEGLSNPQIAGRLMIETSTVKTHLHHVFTKLGVTTRAELAAEAVRRGAARDS